MKMDDFRIFNSRFLERVKDFGEEISVAHLSTDFLFIIHCEGTFTLRFVHEKGKRMVPAIPQNYRLIDDSEREVIIGISDDEQNELLFLLCEANKIIEDSENSQDFRTMFWDLIHQVFRLFGGSEPISIEEQKGIYGELMCLCNIVEEFGMSAITGWSRSALVDIELQPNYPIEVEVKTVSDISSPLVNISFHNQLKHVPDCNTYLYVVQCNTTKTDFTLPTLPDFIEHIVDLNFGGSESTIGQTLIQCLGIQIPGYPWTIHERDRFTTRFVTQDSHSIYQIHSGDSCDMMANLEGLPPGIVPGGYQVDASILSAANELI